MHNFLLNEIYFLFFRSNGSLSRSLYTIVPVWHVLSFGAFQIQWHPFLKDKSFSTWTLNTWGRGWGCVTISKDRIWFHWTIILTALSFFLTNLAMTCPSTRYQWRPAEFRWRSNTVTPSRGHHGHPYLGQQRSRNILSYRTYSEKYPVSFIQDIFR